MFKEYKGFDTEKIYKGAVVYIHDSCECNENITGFYLVNNCIKDYLSLVNDDGDVFQISINKFTETNDETGDYAPYSRLSLEIPKLEL